MEAYILQQHIKDIKNLLETEKVDRKPIQINLRTLLKKNKELFKELCRNFDEEVEKWKDALYKIVDEIVKTEKLTVSEEEMRVIKMEYFNHPHPCWPSFNDLWKLVEVRGYVYRISAVTKLEYKRKIYCSSCKKFAFIFGDRIFNYSFTRPKDCIFNAECNAPMIFVSSDTENTIDFQTIQIQEVMNKTPKKRTFIVQATCNLINSCTIGDIVRILGVSEARMEPKSTNMKTFVIRAVSIRKENSEFKPNLLPEEMSRVMKAWENDKKTFNGSEIEVRNDMLKAVAPDMKAAMGLKLALMITLCSGGKQETLNSYTEYAGQERQNAHLLIAGAPGLGKSCLIKAAMQISARALKMTGNGCTAAGLTASFYREKGEYHVEAGALVLTNNGICCIDEFNLMPTSVRNSLHEVMEQQMFILAKASMKMEIHTKTSVFAAMNHKLNCLPSESRSNAIEGELKILNMEVSLATRFDLIFVVDKPTESYDLDIMEYIFENIDKSVAELQLENSNWDLSRLKLHVICAKNLDVEISEEVYQIISQYFDFCQACEGINVSRKTQRFRKSLQRLTVAHAKMMLRRKTKIIDVMTTIWLMENSWTFGYLIEPINLVGSELPVGPSDECIRNMLEILRLPHLIDTYVEQQGILSDSMNLNEYFSKNVDSDTSEIPSSNHELPKEIQKSFAIRTIEDLFEDDEELPEETHDTSNYNSFSPPTEQISTQIASEPKEDAVKAPVKRTISNSGVRDALKKRKTSDETVEESLAALNSLFQNKCESPIKEKLQQDALPRVLSPSNGQSSSISKEPVAEHKKKPKFTSFVEKLKKYSVSQELDPEKEIVLKAPLIYESMNQIDDINPDD